MIKAFLKALSNYNNINNIYIYILSNNYFKKVLKDISHIIIIMYFK